MDYTSKVKLFFDGSHTDVSSGYGFVLERDSKTILESFGTIPRHFTSNVAEYAGFIAGVKAASELLEANESLQICGDSQLILYQISGKYRVKAEHLKNYCELAKKRIEALKHDGHRVELTWIRREFNKQADKLAAKASNTPCRSGPNLGSNQ